MNSCTAANIILVPDARGPLVKKAETAARRYFDPVPAKLFGILPLANRMMGRERNAGMGGEYMLHGRMADSRRFAVYASALEKWASNDDGYRDCPLMKSEQGKATMGRAFRILERKFGSPWAQGIALEFCNAAKAEFGPDYFNAPSKPERLLDDVLGFEKIGTWIRETSKRDVRKMDLRELNIFRSEVCDSCFAYASPLVKMLVAGVAQELLDRIDAEMRAQKITW